MSAPPARFVSKTSVFIAGGSGRTRPGHDGDVKPVEFKVDTKKGKLLVDKEVPPEFVVKPRRQFVDEGQSAKFKASFEGSSSTILTWLKDGQKVQEDSTHKVYTQEDFHYLEITQVTPGDAGHYTCRIENSAGSSSAIAELEVFEHPKLVSKTRQDTPPSLVSPLLDTTVHAGDRQVRLECTVQDGLDCKVTWFKDGKELPTDSHHRAMFDGSTATLVLREVEEEDSGLYKAVLANNMGTLDSACTLTVEPKLEPPRFVRELHDMEVDDGDKVELTVEVKGSAPVDVFWIFNNTEIATSDPAFRQVVLGNQHRLIIPRAGPRHVGEYVCEAYNDFGDTDTFCMLSVRELVPPSPPSFLEPPLPLTVAEGDSSATFRCRAAGEPPPTALWEKDGKGLHSSHKHKISSQGEEHSLTIGQVGLADAGRYTCRLENGQGSTCHTATLVVRGNQTPNTDFRSMLRARTEQGRPRSLDRTDWRTELTARHHSPSRTPRSAKNSRRSSPPSHAPAPSGQVDFRSVLRRRGDGGEKAPIGTRSKSQDRLGVTSSSVLRGRSAQTGSATRAAAKFQHLEDSRTSKPASVERSRNAALSRVEKAMTSVQAVRPTEHAAPNRLTSPTANGSSKRFTALSGGRGGGVVSRAARQFECGTGASGDTQGGRRELPQSAKTFMAAREVFAAKSASSVASSGQPVSEVRHFGARVGTKTVHSNGTTAKAVGSSSVVSSLRSMASKDSGISSSSFHTSSSSERSLDDHSCRLGDEPTLAPKPVLSRLAPRPDHSPPRQTSSSHNTAPPVKDSLPPPRPASPPSPIPDLPSPEPDPPSPIPSPPSSVPSPSSSVPHPHSSVPSPPSTAASDLPPSPTLKSSLVNSDLRRREASDWRARLAGRYEGRGLPEVRRPLSDQCVRYGCKAVLECEIAGASPPDISWTVNKRMIKVSRFFQMSYEDNTARLVIAEAFSEDEGEYTCTASNSAGTTHTACRLTVQEPSSGSQSSHADFEGPVSVRPQLLNISASSIAMLRGQPAEISVTFTGIPRPDVTWLKGKESLKTDSRVKVRVTEYTSTLTITATEVGDTGSYGVLVENGLGTDSTTLSITVEDVPSAPVGSPHITNVTLTSVSLAWYGPAFDGGSQVTHYAVEVKDTGRSGVWKELTSNCQSTSYEAGGLDTDTEYVFRVRAGNKHGLGPPSQLSDPIMPRDHFDSESEGPPEVFSPGLSHCYNTDEPLPFDHREVIILPDRKFEDHYDVLNEVGKGKFGSVYRCHAKQDGTEWAAKVIKVRPSERDAVLHEIDIMNQLAHPKLLLLRDAFSASRSMTLVMEFIGGGELFERVISEDFVLTERDCVHFMRQIVDGVSFMHTKSIMHLDLKPENILCISPTSNQVKIIDFGLARYYCPGTSLKVMFGTPEFIAPEVINYEEISLATDMWSLGVICYVLLSGLSPFLGDNDAETLANVTRGDFDFDDEAFDVISSSAKNFIESLLVKRKEKRMTIEACQRHKWLAQDERKIRCKRLNTDKLRHFMARRKWQKTGTAIRALGRLGLLQRALSSGSRSLRSESSTGSLDSAPPTPRTPLPSPRPPSPPQLSASLPKVNDDEEDDQEAAARTGGGHDLAGSGGHLAALPGETTLPTRQPRETTTTAAGKELGEAPGEADVARSRPVPRHPPPPTHPPLPNGDAHREERGALPEARELGGRRGAGGRRRLRFEKRMVDCKAFKGDAVRFDVALSAAAHVTWLLDGEELEEDACHLREDGHAGHHSLIIRHVTDDDDGEYTCRAVADDEEISCSAELQVIGSGAF